MISQLYTIYDSKSETYGKPFHEQNTATALRSARNILTNPDSVITHNPEDFTLWHMGEFDDNTGEIELFSPAVCVCKFIDLTGETSHE